MPLEGPAAEAVNAGALRTRGGIGLAPKVVVNGVVTSYGAVPLSAVVRTLLDGSGKDAVLAMRSALNFILKCGRRSKM